MTDGYDIGDLVQLSATFVDSVGIATDPTTVVLRIQSPSGAISTKYHPTPSDLTRDGVGIYHYDLAITEHGIWRYRWEGAGAVQTAGEADVTVRTSRF